mgnify:CR=1 FL=1
MRGLPDRVEGDARGARGSLAVGAARARLPGFGSSAAGATRRNGRDPCRRSRRRPSWRAWWTPAAGLAAAAVSCSPPPSSLAHVEVHRGPDGITVRTGWSCFAPTAVHSADAARARPRRQAQPSGRDGADRRECLVAAIRSTSVPRRDRAPAERARNRLVAGAPACATRRP